MKEWILLDQATDIAATDTLPLPISRILNNRGYDNPTAIDQFLNPQLKDLHSPYVFPDMEKATRRIIEAQKRREKILIYGDYDADGVTSTAMLVLALKSLGIGTTYYIPHRIREGYGLSRAGVDFCLEHDFSVMITVDCGTGAVEEIAAAQESNIDVIVCDHHEPGEKLPLPFAFFNPKLDGCPYPFKELAGAGVTFKLLQALFASFGAAERAYDYLDLCALGTVADVSPLVAENRILVKYGLEEMNRTKNVGLQSLMTMARIADKPRTTYQLSHIIGPRINASGRMGEASLALKLFLTQDIKEATDIGQKLEQENRARQRIEEAILNESMQMAASKDLDKNRVIVLAKEGWHEGVIGIVASRIVEKFGRPTILISLKDERGKGSGRSVPGFHLANALKYCHEHLLSFGGHKQAVGLVIESSKIGPFEKSLCEFASQTPTSAFVPKVYIDTTITLPEIDETLLEFIQKFEPTGVDNPMPTFLEEFRSGWLPQDRGQQSSEVRGS